MDKWNKKPMTGKFVVFEAPPLEVLGVEEKP